MMGCLGGNPIHYTTVGTDVNLASRLCARPKSGEMVFSASAWKAMGERRFPGQQRSNSMTSKVLRTKWLEFISTAIACSLRTVPFQIEASPLKGRLDFSRFNGRSENDKV